MTRCTFLFLFILASCASHRDVRPGEDVNHVVVRAQERRQAEQSAIKQAENYCQESNRHAVFVKEEKTQYTGTMDEGTRDTVHKASTAAMILGGGVGAATQGSARAGGSVLGSAGVLGHAMTNGDDYVADMSFRCK